MSPVSPPQSVPSSYAQLEIWLTDGWTMVVRHFPALVLIALVADLPLTLIRSAADNVDNGVLSFLMGFPAIALITPLAKAAAIVAVDRWDRGQPGAVAAAFGALLRTFPLLLIASLAWTLAVFAGVALLVIPGVIVLVLGQCLMGAVILERRSLKEAARRTVALVRPRFFAVLALFLMVQAIAGVGSAILEPLVGLVADGWVLDLATGALTSPLAFAPLAVQFLRSRALDDGHAAATDSSPGT